MTRLVALIPIALICLMEMGACQVDAGVTVSGTATAPYWDIVSNITVTVMYGSQSYSTQVAAPAVGFLESFSYSVAGVPKGTYSVVFTFTSNIGSLQVNMYSINGGTLLQTTDTVVPDGQYYDYKMEIDNVTIDGDTTVDIQMPNVGG